MRRTALVLLGLMCVGCVSLPTLNVGVAASAVIPEDPDIETTVLADGFVRIDVMMLQVEASMGVATYQYLQGTAEEGELTIIPVALVAKYAVGAGATKFVVGGGLVWNVNDPDDAANVEFDNSEAYRIVVGAQIGLPMRLSFGAEAIYDITDAQLEGLISGDDSNFNALVIRASLGYNF